MRGEEREQHILEGAVRFFAECGFDGQTRELAKRLGISHAVIYRHFDSKEALIERVYEHVYTSRWQAEWQDWIIDRSQPLENRMVRFYQAYAACVFEYEWVRIFIASGLNSYGLPQRYLDIVRTRIILPAIAEMRQELNLPQHAPQEAEEELFWALHGGVFYMAIRKYIYETKVTDDVEAAVTRTVKAFFGGVPAIFRAG
ncbi:TetR/AcrR family transcriptional regulator [Aureimonas fodinaquatilis]|uniref:TetR/AcrR family transcriptional regulator n=2 Tax=Aureimonas fodinaquatilis TaxID=2565783 RepID=A0A5B0E0V0_9HYPH|nr:TetR/AcrR family transcriptional regulator [Aureimonas fodinaquatilis]